MAPRAINTAELPEKIWPDLGPINQVLLALDHTFERITDDAEYNLLRIMDFVTSQQILSPLEQKQLTSYRQRLSETATMVGDILTRRSIEWDYDLAHEYFSLLEQCGVMLPEGIIKLDNRGEV